MRGVALWLFVDTALGHLQPSSDRQKRYDHQRREDHRRTGALKAAETAEPEMHRSKLSFASVFIAVVLGTAFGASFLVVAILRPHPAFLRFCVWVFGLEAAVGALGFVLHLSSDGSSPTASVADRLVFGAPVFAPLLFTNMALLACVGPGTDTVPFPSSSN